jgi:fumarylacetoacetase
MTDPTLDPARRSWIVSANGHPEFPIQNLPLGIFTPPGGVPRGGVAIGDMIIDLQGCLNAGLLSGAAARAAEAASGRTLNPLLALGPAARIALRRRVAELLDQDSDDAAVAEKLVYLADDCALHLPAAVGDYTDFFAGIHHARNTGRLLRPDAPLTPNYRHLPIAYHGRASSLRVSGEDVHRPVGQRKPGKQELPDLGPCRYMDYELEFGIWIGPGNPQGQRIPLAEATHHIAGFCLLNDWSARDMQMWEAQPLGPFLAKNFATTLSPWIITPEALAPFRTAPMPRAADDPPLLGYLADDADRRHGGLDIHLQVLLHTPQMRAAGQPPEVITDTNAANLYWTAAQMVAHHTVGGCNLAAGDLFGSGTISSTERRGFGSLLEISGGGREPLALASGETRTFLEDGDEVILRGHCERDGYARIGFGECRARVLPAVA